MDTLRWWLLVLSLLLLLPSTIDGGALVIGGTGRLGRAVCAELRRADIPTTVLVRNRSAAEGLSELQGCELVVGDVGDLQSLRNACSNLQGIDSVISVHGVRPPRLSRFTDFFGQQVKDAGHPAMVNYQGTMNLLELAKEKNVRKIVRITGALVGLPNNLFCALFNILLSMTVKYHELSEIAIRKSGMDYAVIRPTGIREEASCAECNAAIAGDPTASKDKGSKRTCLVALQGDRGNSVKLPGKISTKDLAQLCVIASRPSSLSSLSLPPRSTLIVSTEAAKEGGPSEGEAEETWAQVLSSPHNSFQSDYKVLMPGPHRRNALVTLLALGGFVYGALFVAVKAALSVAWLVSGLKRMLN